MATVNLYDVAAAAREKAAADRGLRADGYSGKNRYQVLHGGSRAVTVFARDAASAIWTAAGYWGMDPRKVEFHQNCRVRKC